MGTYTDEQGVVWDSVREHDLAVTAGRYADAMIEWKRQHGHKLLEKHDDGTITILHPNPYEIAKRVCVDPDNVNDAGHEAVDAWLFDLRLRRMMRHRSQSR